MVLLVGLAALVIRGAARTSQARAHRQQMVTLARDTTMVSAGLVQGTVRRELVPRGEGQGTAPDELRERAGTDSCERGACHGAPTFGSHHY